MKRRARFALAAVAGVGVAALLLMDFIGDVAERSEPDARRGRLLFQRGVDADGTAIVGRLDGLDVELEAAAAACAKCHGHDGLGTREGGVEAPEITARALRAESKRRTALDDDALVAAIVEGRLPGGRRLGSSMPRYALGERDRRDLVAWLRTMGDASDPGVSADAIRIGAFLQGPTGAAMRGVLEASFAEVNERGGIYRRRLELVDAGGADEARFLEGDIFAIAGGWLPQGEEARAVLEREGIPAVAPVGERGKGSLVFHLYPTQEELARVAVQQLLRSRPAFRPFVIHVEDDDGRAWLRGAQVEAERRGNEVLPALGHAPGAFDAQAALSALRAADADVVLFFGSADALVELASALDAAGLATTVQAPVQIAPETIARARTPLRRVFFWSPTLLGEPAQPGIESFHAFLRRHGLEASRDPAQHHAYAAARLLTEGLRRAGSPPTRAGLVEALQSLHEFPTGVTPPVTWGRYRRTGIRGAYLVRPEPGSLRLVRATDWAELAPP